MLKLFARFLIITIMASPIFCAAQHPKMMNARMPIDSVKRDTAVFAMGCFWCTDADFEQLIGVLSVTAGYTGGTMANPTYEQVCTGTTGHAEASMIIFDANKISYSELLEAFWKAHDPTTLNKQGADEGTQYRSAIFYKNIAQKTQAEKYKKELDGSGAFSKPIVTTITPFTVFYKAEDYHQAYFDKNGHAPYCTMVIAPKVEKFREVFHDKVKPAN